MKIKELLNYLDEKAPFASAEGFDNVGLLIGDGNTEIAGVCCCLDITHDIIKEAHEKGANLIVSHHPVIFSGLKTIPEWSVVPSLIRNNISVIAMHTNFDKAENGVNETLAELLDFNIIDIPDYEQFHDGFGLVCNVALGYTPEHLAEYCKEKLSLGGVRYSSHKNVINRIALCCGAGIDADVMQYARENAVDAVISGDIKHNFWIEAENCGITLIDAGHFGTEKAAAHRLAKLVTEKIPSVPVFSAECEHDPCRYV